MFWFFFFHSVKLFQLFVFCLDLKDALLVMEYSGAGTDKDRLQTVLTYVGTFLPVVHG